MEDSKKKPIMIAVVTACLVLAVAITLMTGSGDKGGIDGIKAGDMWLVKCSNPDCGVEYPMDRKEYLETMRLRSQKTGSLRPALICKDCGEESVYEAEKCEKCGLVFFSGSVRGDFTDRCPDCGYSKKEEMRTGQ